MPWFKIDDSSHSHPKFVRAGNAALGLWVRCGAYSAQHLTEGHVPAEIVRVYGSPAQAAKLVKVANGGDVAAIKAQSQALGKTCKSCHDKFREEED